MKNLIQASKDGRMNAKVKIVISPKDHTPAVNYANTENIQTAILPYQSTSYDSELLHILTKNQIELICLAGYMTLLPIAIIQQYPNRILNIHPALLPKFGGKGMYGMNVHKAVIEAREKESGCTVHYVTQHYDEGAPILQVKVPVSNSDTPESLAAKVNTAEMEAFPMAINLALNS